MAIQVYQYKVRNADGDWQEMPDKITLDRAAELGAEIILGTTQIVPRTAVSPEGHYTPSSESEPMS